MTDQNNVFMNFFNYINDLRNEKDPSRFLSKRVLQGDSYGLDTNISFQFTGGCAYGHGYIGAMFFAVIKTPGGYVYKTGNDIISGSIAEEPIVQILDFLDEFLQQLIKYNPSAQGLPELASRVFSEPAVPTSDDPEFLDRMLRKIVNVDAWNSDTYGKVTSYGTFDGHQMKVVFQHTVGSVFVTIENETNKDNVIVIVVPYNQNIQVHYLDALSQFDAATSVPDWVLQPQNFDKLYELVSHHIV